MQVRLRYAEVFNCSDMAKIKRTPTKKTPAEEPVIAIDQFILGIAIGAVIGALLVSLIMFVSLEETNMETLKDIKEITQQQNSVYQAQQQ